MSVLEVEVEEAPVVDWVLDAAARARVLAALNAIDRSHERYPQCVLCGQRALALDKFGTCSKTSKPHLEFRAEALAMQSVGIR